MTAAALGALATLAAIFFGALALAWWGANKFCDYLERGRW